MRADLDHLLADLLRGLMYGDAAHGEAAATERADSHAGRFEGVAVTDLDVVRADTQRIGRDLRPGRLVALAVRGCPGEHLDRTRGVNADARAFVATPAHAERGVRLRRGEAADLDVARDPDAAVVAARFRFGAPLLEALVVGHRERAVERGRVVAAVVRDAADRVEREGVGRDEVLTAELGRVHPDLVGETVDDPLHRVGRLGAAGAAVGIHGRRVGVCAADLDVESRNDVGPGNDERMKDRGTHRRKRL